MSTGSKALDRKVDEWLNNIASGRLRLPSFQRGMAWDRRRVASMLDTILHDLPLGITLVLDVGDEEKFHSRPLETAPDREVKVPEHLLDGQQRLTALWRALKDNNLRETYFVHVPELDDDPDNDDVRRSVCAHRSRTWGGAGRGLRPNSLTWEILPRAAASAQQTPPERTQLEAASGALLGGAADPWAA